jgi:hypothetical protein
MVNLAFQFHVHLYLLPALQPINDAIYRDNGVSHYYPYVLNENRDCPISSFVT